VREDIIVKSFKKCGISNALDGSEDHLIYEEDNDDDEEEEEDEVLMTIFRDSEGQFGFIN
jgi:hypothetical protein